jgi:hypothetical protein
VDHDETFSVDQSDRNLPHLSVTVSVIDPSEGEVLKNQRRISKIDAVLVNVGLSFGFIPFKFHV